MTRITFKLIFICILSLKTSSTLNLKDTITNTDHFFNNILKKYEMTELNKVKVSIDKEINQYLNIASQQLQAIRYKKDLANTNVQLKEAEVFDSLEEIISFNVSSVKNMNIFKKYSGYEQWFGAALNSSGITIYRIYQNTFIPVIFFSVENASKLHTVKFHTSDLLFVQKSQSILVLYFFSQDGKFTIKESYKFDVEGLEDLSVWSRKDELLLAASTTTQICIYSWQINRFDRVQMLPFGSKFAKPFQLHDGHEFLVASSHPLRKAATMIFYFDLQTRKFVVTQTIQRSFDDADLLNMQSSKTSESFLALSNGKVSTIIYKRTDGNSDGYMPFQEIDPADKVVVIRKNSALLILLLKDGELKVYQYDGWRFIRLDNEINGIEGVEMTFFEGEQRILIKRVDGSWSLNRIKWAILNQPLNLENEIKQWCLSAKEKAKEIPKHLSQIERTMNISARQVQRVKVKSINQMSIQKLQNLTEHYNQLISRLSAINESLNQATPLDNRRFTSLRAQTMRANCINTCSAKKLVTKLDCDIFTKLHRVDDKTQNLRFEHVKVDKLDDFPCPVAAVELKKVNVKGLINGLSFDELQKNTLKTSGDQEIIAEHIFENLQVDALYAPNLEPASNHTRQRIRATSIRTKELNLTDGGLLLPLNGEPVMMTGILTASKVRFNGLVDQHGGLKGTIKRYAPMVYFQESHELTGDYNLNNVKITGLLSASDVARRKGGSEKTLGEIAERAVRLDEDVPVRLELSSNATLWTNITVENLPNWLTRKNSEMIKVIGTKIALQNVMLPDALYSKLPVPRIRAHICSIGAVISDIKTSMIRVGQTTAKVVESDNIIGAKELDNAMRDAVTSLDEVDLSEKNFTGTIRVENLNIANLENSPFSGFQRTKFKWHRPEVVEGPITAKVLKVNSLTTVKGLKIPPPTEIKNMIVDGNLQVNRINGIKLNEFFDNIVNINEKVSLKKVTFEGILDIDEVEADSLNIDLTNFENGGYLGNKIIAGDLEIEHDLWIPNFLSYPPIDTVDSYVVEGSVKFENEPDVINFNGQNLHKLLSEIWMLNHPTNLTGNFKFKNVSLLKFSNSYESIQTPNFGSWMSLESSLLSKTKLQEIQIPIYLKTATIPNIIMKENSKLNSSDPHLNDLFYNTLKKDKDQIIKEKWHLDKLIIKENLTLLGKINNLNLSSDVARYNVNINHVTGTKIVNELTVRNLEGLNFKEWVKDVFVPSDTERLTIIKGRKTFNNLNARIVKVIGTVMGKKLDECLLKTGDQIITAPKIINGSLQATSIQIDGLINDINLIDFRNNRLNKSELIQKIKSKVIFKGNVYVKGDLSIMNTFQGIQLLKMNLINESIVPSMKKVAYLKPLAIAVEHVTKRQAKYWNKFEYVKEDAISPLDVSGLMNITSINFHKLGNCVLTNLYEVVCDRHSKFLLKIISNSTAVLVNQMLIVDDSLLVIQVSSSARSRITIHVYDNETDSFVITANIRAPGIIQASVCTHQGVVWIATRLNTEMLLVRFEPWGDLQKYHLSDSRIFAVDVVPKTYEVILIREDGMWKLDGLIGPRHIFKANLSADKIETFVRNQDFFVRLVCKNKGSKLLKARYVGIYN